MTINVIAPSCVGREAEVSELYALHQSSVNGERQFVVLRGARGIGKTEILAELRGQVRMGGGVVLEGRCHPGSAYGPFAEILEAALKFLHEVGVSPSAGESALACASGCHAFWFQHGTVAELPQESSGGSTVGAGLLGDDTAETRHRFFEAAISLLEDVARVRPPVIVAHGMSTATRGTLELFQHLNDSAMGPISTKPDGSSAPGWLTVLSVDETPGSELPATLRGFLRSIRSHTIDVAELDVDGVRAYLHSPRVLQRILDRTGGRPEVIDRLLAAEPLSVEEMLAIEIDAVLSEARPWLNALAILDDHADLALLARVADAPQTADARKSFRESRLLSHTISEGRILFRLANQATRAAIAEGIPESESRRLHSRAADAYAAQPGGTVRAARHAIEAKDTARLVSMALRAARLLAARHAHHEGAALLELALQVEGVEPSRAALAYLAELYRIAGDYSSALRYAERVCELEPAAAEAVLRVGHLLMLAGRLEEAAVRFSEAHSLATQNALEEVRVEVEASLAELSYQRNAFDEAREWAERASTDAAARGYRAFQVHAGNTLGKVLLAQGHVAEAAEAFSANLEHAREALLPHHESQALTNLGVTQLRMQRLEEAEKTFEQAVRVARAAGDTRERAIATENLAVLAHLRRDYGIALERYHQAIDVLKSLGNRAMLARAANNLGELYLSLGAQDRASALCNYATHVGGTAVSPIIVAEGLLLRGRVARLMGESDNARASFEGALRAFISVGSERREDASFELAKLALHDGYTDEAKRGLFELPKSSSAKRRALRALLGCDVARSVGQRALEPAQRARDLAEELGDDGLRVPAFYRYARCLADEADFQGARELLDRAYEADARMSRNLRGEQLDTWQSREDYTLILELEARLKDTKGARDVRMSQPPRNDSAASDKFELYPEIVGRSAKLGRLLSLIEKVAPTEALVLIRGESGTGKELIAEAIHRNSSRAKAPLVKVNCAALVETLLLSELFGHEKGAFTGADARKKGRFELADGGTLFLDEIGDISPKTQVALLRVLQERRFERVGGTEPIDVDVRILAATHRDLEDMVRRGEFREDLYYRLRGVVLTSPPLRERGEDISHLAEHILRRIALEREAAPHRLSVTSLDLLSAHRWPGNIRELENVLRSATLFADSDILMPNDFRAFSDMFDEPNEDKAEASEANGTNSSREPQSLAEAVFEQVRGGAYSVAEMKKAFEKECISRALSESGGNITQAADILGMKRPRLSQLVKQYNLLAKSPKP